MPVYLHYCGGELETLSVLVKSTSCCGEDETDMDDGCCADENTIVRCAPDFTAKKINSSNSFNIQSLDVFFSPLFQLVINSVEKLNFTQEINFPPPKLIQQNIVKFSVLLI